MGVKTKAQLLVEIKDLKNRLAELQAIEAKSHPKSEIYKKQVHALGERVKELDCLYGISHLIEIPNISLQDIFKGTVKLLPLAWQYPKTTCARITLDNQEYKTKNFHETKWKLASEIKVEGKHAGLIEVFYLEKQPKIYEGPFLKEERALIDAVSERLGNVIQRMQAQERTKHLALVLRSIRNINQLIIREKNRDVLIHEVCDSLIETRGYSTAWIALVDASGKLSASEEAGLGDKFSPLRSDLKRGDFPACVQQTLTHPGPIKITDPSSICADCPIFEKYSSKGRMTVQLEHAGVVYGFLAVSVIADSTIDKEERNLINAICKQLGIIIEQVQAEKELQESHHYYRSLLNQLHEDVIVIDREYKITDINNTFLSTTGYRRDEVIGKHCYEISHGYNQPCEKEGEDCKLQEVFITGISSKCIHEHVQKDGSIAPVDILFSPLTDNEGKVTHVIESIRDLSDLYKTQFNLEESKNRFDLAMVATKDGLYDWNLITNEIYYSPGWKSMLGYKNDELPNDFSVWEDLTEPEDVKKTLEMQQELINKQRERFEIEFKMKHKDGHWVDILSLATAIFDESGKAIRMIGTHIDISERKRVENKLKQNEMQYRSVVEDSPGLICRYLPDATITFANQVFCKFFGNEPDELIGTNMLEKISKESRKSVWSKITSLTRESYTHVSENENINSEGAVRQMRWTRRALFNEKGKLTGYQSFGEDITDQNRSQQFLNALNQASVAIGSAITKQNIFDSIAEELEQLDITCMLFPLDETRTKLVTKYVSFDYKLLNPIEKLAGFTYKEYSFPINAVEIFHKVIEKKESLFENASEKTVGQLFPNISMKIISLIFKISQGTKIITSPLIVDGKVAGIFLVQSKTLIQQDVPAATAFADQLSSAWNKVQLVEDLRKTVEGTINTIAATVEARDPYTAGHQKRVADLAVAIASEMKLTDAQVEGLRMAGIIHDLGKINVPAEILSKPGKLSELEFSLIKTHSQNGYDLLKNIEFPWPIAKMVRQHHEKMDGSGYPQGLKGDEILLESRILDVADVVEAMSSHRPYRPALGIEKSLDQIKKDKGTLFDPDVVDACLKIFKEGYKFLEN
jgi:PAS domain S-box-containing protein/putative nucleotidyltransferase with HDIG domain